MNPSLIQSFFTKVTSIITSHSISRGLGRIVQISLRASAICNDYETTLLYKNIFDLLFSCLISDVSIQKLHHSLAQRTAEVIPWFNLRTLIEDNESQKTDEETPWIHSDSQLSLILRWIDVICYLRKVLIIERRLLL